MDHNPYDDNVKQFIHWHGTLEPQFQVQVHQLLDTFLCHWKWCQTKPTLDIFDVSEDMKGQKGCKVLTFFLSLNDSMIDNTLAILNPVFPQGYQRLPALRAIDPAQPVHPINPVNPANPTQSQTAIDLEALLLEKDHVYRPMFRDIEHLRRTKELYQQYNDKKEDKNAKHQTNVPDTALACDWATAVVKVGEIFDALVDITDLHDKGKMAFDPAVGGNIEAKEKNTAVRRMLNCSNFELQLLAWDIWLFSGEAQNGRVGISPWVERWSYEKFATHELRLTKIKDGLKHHKAFLKDFITANPVRRFVAAPATEIKSKNDNQVLNDNRAADKRARDASRAAQGSAVGNLAANVTAAAPVQPLGGNQATSQGNSQASDQMAVQETSQANGHVAVQTNSQASDREANRTVHPLLNRARKRVASAMSGGPDQAPPRSGHGPSSLTSEANGDQTRGSSATPTYLLPEPQAFGTHLSTIHAGGSTQASNPTVVDYLLLEPRAFGAHTAAPLGGRGTQTGNPIATTYHMPEPQAVGNRPSTPFSGGSTYTSNLATTYQLPEAHAVGAHMPAPLARGSTQTSNLTTSVANSQYDPPHGSQDSYAIQYDGRGNLPWNHEWDAFVNFPGDTRK